MGVVRPYSQKVARGPIAKSNGGKVWATKAHPTQSEKIEIDIALPRMAVGNISDTITQHTDPYEKLKHAQ